MTNFENTYETTKVKFEELTKKLNRLFKKIEVSGGHYEFHKIDETVKEVPVYTIDPITQTRHKIDIARVECVRFVLNFDTHKVGDYRLGAILERTAEDDNLVYTMDDTVNFQKYAKAPLRCDHCGTNHNRKKAVVIIDNNTGNEIMVGKECLKDFIGINTYNFASYLYGVNDILLGLDEMKIYDTEMHLYQRIIDTKEYLAYCIKITENKGYYKSLKEDALYEMKKNNKIDNKYYEMADTMIKFFENYTPEDDFEHNIKMFVTGKSNIVRENGFVAYAYTTYKKIQERIKRKRLAEEAAKNSDFVGNIGDKIQFNTNKFDLVGGYETQFGYVRIYKFYDENGNIFVWKTTSGFNTEDFTTITVKGTIKEHNEYRSEKQTVLTRCKVCGVA